MRVVVQRCSNACVTVDSKVAGKIDNGLMLLVGFCDNDNIDTINYMAKKIVNLRIFPDEENVMNKSLLDVNGSILSVSQFTLYADTKKGNRPSYINALKSDKAEKLYLEFNKVLSTYTKVESGIFGSDMDVSFTNKGPTTILLER